LSRPKAFIFQETTSKALPWTRKGLGNALGSKEEEEKREERKERKEMGEEEGNKIPLGFAKENTHAQGAAMIREMHGAEVDMWLSE
jgi:hypothetical protein